MSPAAAGIADPVKAKGYSYVPYLSCPAKLWYKTKETNKLKLWKAFSFLLCKQVEIPPTATDEKCCSLCPEGHDKGLLKAFKRPLKGF